MDMIGGPGFGAKKKRSMIGGDDAETEAESDPGESDETSQMDAKDEAAGMLVRALGIPSERTGRLRKALEAFVYACQSEE